MTLFQIVMPAVFLAWLVATAGLAAAGIRRWRWNTPGGLSAALAALAGLLFPVAVLLQIMVEMVAPRAALWLNDRGWIQVLIAAPWLVSVWLSAWAASRALRPRIPGPAAAPSTGRDVP
ncbi:hypothetical protein [Alienimonas sp. DA493]|uniref:hypothetical protein n=1 Tax=Alienimonas sp. DA493 TaxID=3373605 RepID=UPI00375414B9